MREDNPEFSRLYKKAWHLKKTADTTKPAIWKNNTTDASKDVDDPTIDAFDTFAMLMTSCWASRVHDGSTGNQGKTTGVPARSSPTGTVRGETLITHARTEVAKFLGYEIVTQQADSNTRVENARQWSHRLRVPLCL